MRAGLRPLLRAKPPSAQHPAAAARLQKRTHSSHTHMHTPTAARSPPSVDSARTYCAALLQYAPPPPPSPPSPAPRTIS